MQFESRDIVWTSYMKESCKKELENKLTRLSYDDASANIRLSKEKELFKIEILYGEYRVQVLNEDFYLGFKMACNKLKKLILRKTKKKHAQIDIFDYITDNSLVSKEKLFILNPMSLNQAVDAFQATDYSFYLFKDIDYENNTSVLYRRTDGSLGIVRCR